MVYYRKYRRTGRSTYRRRGRSGYSMYKLYKSRSAGAQARQIYGLNKKLKAIQRKTRPEINIAPLVQSTFRSDQGTAVYTNSNVKFFGPIQLTNLISQDATAQTGFARLEGRFARIQNITIKGTFTYLNPTAGVNIGVQDLQRQPAYARVVIYQTKTTRFKSIGEVERMSVTDRKELGLQFYNIIEKINSKEAFEKQRHNRYYKPVVVEWHYGSTGSGKTRWAFEHGFETVYECKNEMLNDFGDARNIVFEEFRGKMSYDRLLQLTDSYHNYYKFRILYGWKLIDVDFVYIASSKPPWEIYRKQIHSTDSINQLMRRLNFTVYEHRPGEIRTHHWDEQHLIDSVGDWEPYVFDEK